MPFKALPPFSVSLDIPSLSASAAATEDSQPSPLFRLFRDPIQKYVHPSDEEGALQPSKKLEERFEKRGEHVEEGGRGNGRLEAADTRISRQVPLTAHHPTSHVVTDVTPSSLAIIARVKHFNGAAGDQ